MNSLDVIRSLVEKFDIECSTTFVLNGTDCKWCGYYRRCEVLATARAYLKTGGWITDPDDKPEGDGVNCLVWLSDDTIFIGEWFTYPEKFWNDPLTNQDFAPLRVIGWQPLPPLPSDKPEEKCPRCHGEGVDGIDHEGQETPCSKCKGTGKVKPEELHSATPESEGK